jgi:hypothetical protein
MDYDELELDTLGDEKTALFVIIPDTDDSFNFIAAMMYTQMFNRFPYAKSRHNCAYGYLLISARASMD